MCGKNYAKSGYPKIGRRHIPRCLGTVNVCLGHVEWTSVPGSAPEARFYSSINVSLAAFVCMLLMRDNKK